MLCSALHPSHFSWRPRNRHDSAFRPRRCLNPTCQSSCTPCRSHRAALVATISYLLYHLQTMNFPSCRPIASFNSRAQRQRVFVASAASMEKRVTYSCVTFQQHALRCCCLRLGDLHVLYSYVTVIVTHFKRLLSLIGILSCLNSNGPALFYHFGRGGLCVCVYYRRCAWGRVQ
jgi:hypothetical protein